MHFYGYIAQFEEYILLKCHTFHRTEEYLLVYNPLHHFTSAIVSCSVNIYLKM